MTSKDKGQISKQKARIGLAYAQFAVARYWWLVLLMTGLGIGVGYMVSVRISNQYEAKASFVVHLDDAMREFERLSSRALVLRTIAQKPDLRQSLLIVHPKNGLLEMYDEAPFRVDVRHFPESMEDADHRLRFLNDSVYELTLRLDGEEFKEQGRVGEPLKAFAVEWVVDRSAYWRAESPRYEYYVRIASEQALLGNIIRKLSVFQPATRSNRLEVTYVDAHPGRALDFLETFTKAYLDYGLAHARALIAERRQALEGEIRAMELQMRLNGDADAQWREALKGFGLFQDTELLTRLKDLRQQLTNLQARTDLWARSGTISIRQLRDAFQPLAVSAGDTALLEAMGQSIQADPSGSLVQERVAQQAAMDAHLLQQSDSAYTAANVELVSILSLISDPIDPQDPGQAKARPHDIPRYLAALGELAEIDLEMRQELSRLPELIDPPYVVSQYREQLKRRNFAAVVLGLFLIGMAMALALPMLGRKVRALPQFQLAAGVEEVDEWRIAAEEPVQRQQAAALEMRLEPGENWIALVGEAACVAAISAEVATHWQRFGKRVLVLSEVATQTEQPWQQASNHLSTDAGWWFSQEARQWLQAQAASHDRILICLPFPATAPETYAAVRLSHRTYFVAQRGHRHLREWKELSTACSDMDTRLGVLFVH